MYLKYCIYYTTDRPIFPSVGIFKTKKSQDHLDPNFSISTNYFTASFKASTLSKRSHGRSISVRPI